MAVTLTIELVQRLLPWMPVNLAQVYLDAYTEYGSDSELALQEVRNGKGKAVYDAEFPGMRRDDGTFRFSSEAAYLSTRQQYRNSLAQRGLNPELFEQSLTNLIEGEVSASEFEQRVAAVNENIAQRGELIREAFAQASGVADFSPEAVLATVLDPEGVGRELLERRIAVAQVRGTAREFGFDRSISRADDLVARGGLTLQGAREFFAQAGGLTTAFSDIARRFDRTDRNVDVTELEDALLLQEQEQAQRLERLLAQERSTFTRRTGSVATSSTGAVTGLSSQRQ